MLLLISTWTHTGWENYDTYFCHLSLNKVVTVSALFSLPAAAASSTWQDVQSGSGRA